MPAPAHLIRLRRPGSSRSRRCIARASGLRSCRRVVVGLGAQRPLQEVLEARRLPHGPLGAAKCDIFSDRRLLPLFGLAGRFIQLLPGGLLAQRKQGLLTYRWLLTHPSSLARRCALLLQGR